MISMLYKDILGVETQMVILIIVHNSVNEEHQHLTRGLMVIQTSGMACTLHTTPPYVMIWVFLCASK